MTKLENGKCVKIMDDAIIHGKWAEEYYKELTRCLLELALNMKERQNYRN